MFIFPICQLPSVFLLRILSSMKSMKSRNTILKGTTELTRKAGQFTLKDSVKLILTSSCKWPPWIDMLSIMFKSLRGHLLLNSHLAALLLKGILIRAPPFWMFKEWYINTSFCSSGYQFLSCCLKSRRINVWNPKLILIIWLLGI